MNATTTQIESNKVSKHGRNRLVYLTIKLQGSQGATRQELVALTGFEINQCASAVGALLQDGVIMTSGVRINPETGLGNEVLVIGQGDTKPSRKGELAKLRQQNQKLISLLKKYVEKYGLLD